MSDERTQPPSKRRRQLARQEGKAAHSPELTAAAGWLVAVIVLSIFGGDLMLELGNLVRRSPLHPALLPANPTAVAAHLRGQALVLAWPLGAVLAGFAGGALVAHQLQVRGLWAPRLIAPDMRRLWVFSNGPSLAVRSSQSSWSIIKAIVFFACVTWALQSNWSGLLRLSALEGPHLALAVGEVVLRLGWILAAVLAALGLVDYVVRYRRFEAMLRTTPEQQREDRRVMEGDAAARAQRRSVARAWRGDSPELLAGATLLLTGPGGLTLVLAGGPPPRRVSVRAAVRGIAGLKLRRSAEANQVAHVRAPELARRLALRPKQGSPVAAELMAELAAIWPPA
jgi:flagellar biosynthetic protein FlhB